MTPVPAIATKYRAAQFTPEMRFSAPIMSCLAWRTINDASAQLPRLDGLQANVHVFAEEVPNLRSMGLGKRIRAQVGGADRVGLLDDQPPPDVEARGGQPEREREEEGEQRERRRHHLADGGPILLLRSPSPIHPQPIS